MNFSSLLKTGLALTGGVLLLSGCGGGGTSEPTRGFSGTNVAPRIERIGARSVAPGETLTFPVNASDQNEDPITLIVQGLPAGASFNAATGDFSWTPDERAAGVHYLAFIAADASLRTSETIEIVVRPATLTEPAVFRGTTTFGQSIPALDSDPEIFPGQANVWDLDRDLALLSGGDGQFDAGGGLFLSVGDALLEFPNDQAYDELTWSGPLFTQSGAGDGGIKTVAVAGPEFLFLEPLAGTYSAFLNATSDSRLQQVVDLTGVSASAGLKLSWVSDHLLSGNFPGTPLRYELVIRDLAGAELRRVDLDAVNVPAELDVSSLAGMKIEISFETFNTLLGFNQIDDISLKDASGREYLVNGNFETGDLRGWKTPLAIESQHVTTAPRTIDGTLAGTTPFNLRITRSFYTTPRSLWGRWVDIFENTGTEQVTVPVTYTVQLGAHLTDNTEGTAVIYDPETGGRALSIWDARELIGTPGSRDIGLVFGALHPEYLSLDNPAGTSGSSDIDLKGDLVLAPGESAAIVNFIVMTGRDSGETATDFSARAAEVDAAAQTIVRDFWTDPQYREGIPEIRILNFPQ